MRAFIIALICLLPIISNAQSSPCNDFRFLQVIFTDTESTNDIKYGENTTIGGVASRSSWRLAGLFPAVTGATFRPSARILRRGAM